MDENGKLFIDTVEELNRAINSNDDYQLLKSCGMIRRLFLDGGNSLVTQVNRKYGLKINFEVVEPESRKKLSSLEIIIWCALDEIDPRSVSSSNSPTNKNKKDFLKFIVAVSDNYEFSVKDIIKFGAHKGGVIHGDTPKNNKDIALAKLKDFYHTSNRINALLLLVRVIGRIILEALKPLKYKVLGLEIFENSPGISIYGAWILYPMGLDKNNYIFDIGVEENRNRISIFVDTRNELCFRYIDLNGEIHRVFTGQNNHSYQYGVPVFLCFEIGVANKKRLINVQAGRWSYTKVIYNTSPVFDFNDFHYVMGSDIFGKAETNMSLIEKFVYNRILEPKEKELCFNFLYRGFNDPKEAIGRLRFKGNQFMHSEKHPNFPENNS